MSTWPSIMRKCHLILTFLHLIFNCRTKWNMTLKVGFLFIILSARKWRERRILHELPQTPCRKAASSRRDPLSDLSTHHFGLATALLCHNRRCYTLIQKGNPGTPWISLNRDRFPLNQGLYQCPVCNALLRKRLYLCQNCIQKRRKKPSFCRKMMNKRNQLILK